MENFICSICNKHITNEFSNNAWPINEGRCCNDCNNSIVIPRRIEEMTGKRIVMSKLEEYWNGVEIDRQIFTVLLRLKNDEGELTNEYIVTRDGYEIRRFITSTEDQAKHLFRNTIE